jgi:hypothetical protein
MSGYGYDANNATVGQAACTYSSLKQSGKAPRDRGVPRQDCQVVPIYPQVGYDALTHGQPAGCSGYFNYNKAYHNPALAGACTQYTTRKSDGFDRC